MRKNIRVLGIFLLIAGLGVARPAAAQSDYYRHVFFDNSQQLAQYFQSSAAATEPSELKSAGYRLPVESTVFRTPPNALRIEWTVGARRQLGRADSIRQFPEPFPGLCRSDALFLGLFAGSPSRPTTCPT